MADDKRTDDVEKILHDEKSLEDRKHALIADLLKQREAAISAFDEKLAKLGYRANSGKTKRSHHKRGGPAPGAGNATDESGEAESLRRAPAQGIGTRKGRDSAQPRCGDQKCGGSGRSLRARSGAAGCAHAYSWAFQFLYRFCTWTLLLMLLVTSATLYNQQVTELQKPVKIVVRIHAGEPLIWSEPSLPVTSQEDR